ncbi:MAG: TetR/AcrR family transcriptional regulator [Gammaproteobacteria bacterium]|nr:TetR/AcrR family transcriptional regulator [Gammaproteobacteria bacterium]
MSNVTSSLELRRKPTQERARATFDLILNATAELLEETGFDGFNTNLLSARAGVGVRAIYRYFPNKHALVIELARRMAERWRAELGSGVAFADPDSDWRRLWCSYLDRFVRSVHSTTGGVAVLQAMRSHPQLRTVDDVANAVYVADVADALGRRCPHMGKNETKIVATALLTTTVAIIDATLDERPTNAKKLLGALKTMHLAYLEEWLDLK